MSDHDIFTKIELITHSKMDQSVELPDVELDNNQNYVEEEPGKISVKSGKFLDKTHCSDCK